MESKPLGNLSILNLTAGILAICLTAYAGEPVTNQNNIVLLSKEWQNVNYLAGHVIVHGTRGFKPGENLVANTESKEDTDGHFLRQYQSQRYGSEEFNMAITFDGTKYRAFDEAGAPAAPMLMKVSARVPKTLPFFSEDFPLEPYQFLIQTSADTNARYPGIRDLASFAELSSTANLGKLLRLTKFEGGPALSMNFPGGADWAGNKISYVAYFDTDQSHKLLGWKCTYPDQKLYGALFVTNWQTITPANSKTAILYPSQYVVRYYSDSNSLDQGISYEYSGTIVLDSISDKSNMSAFEIEPARASLVYDLDTRTLIRNSINP